MWMTYKERHTEPIWSDGGDSHIRVAAEKGHNETSQENQMHTASFWDPAIRQGQLPIQRNMLFNEYENYVHGENSNCAIDCPLSPKQEKTDSADPAKNNLQKQGFMARNMYSITHTRWHSALCNT